MPRVLEKTERRLGEKLFLKGDRCTGPKCAMVRRAYPPGFHGKKIGRRRNLSEYGELLRVKQKIRFLYGLDDKDIKRYAKEAALMTGVFSSNITRLLESRLDNIVFRSGFAVSRRMARSMVNHGHILVNGKVVNVPSYRVKKGDHVALKDKSFSEEYLSELDAKLKKFETPKWLALDKSKRECTVVDIPEVEEFETMFDISKIKEFYSS
jgi:small subunit ribosomal protein S4